MPSLKSQYNPRSAGDIPRTRGYPADLMGAKQAGANTTPIMLPMSLPRCAECRSIYLELVEAAEAIRKLQADQPGATDLAAWLDGLSEGECAETRETSRLWAVWRRQREHRILTGHYVPLSLWPGEATPNRN